MHCVWNERIVIFFSNPSNKALTTNQITENILDSSGETTAAISCWSVKKLVNSWCISFKQPSQTPTLKSKHSLRKWTSDEIGFKFKRFTILFDSIDFLLMQLPHFIHVISDFELSHAIESFSTLFMCLLNYFLNLLRAHAHKVLPESSGEHLNQSTEVNLAR